MSDETQARIAEFEEQARVESVVLECMDDAVVIVDESGTVKSCNAAARNLLGTELLLVDLADWVERYGLCEQEGPTPLEVNAFPLTRALAGESVRGEELLMRSSAAAPEKPTWLSVSAQPIRDDRGRRQGAFMVLRDISARKSAQDEIALLERAMESTSEGVSITDPNQPGNPLIYINKGFERITGYARADVLGKNCGFLQGPQTDPGAARAIGEAIRAERPITVELLNYRKNGEAFWNRLSIAPMRDAAGRLKHFVGIQSDITERVITERRLQKTSRDLEAANLRLMQNLEAAARVQAALLPAARPEMPGVEFAWRFQPCEHLAGDILNVMRLDETHVAMYVLDVTGHGTAAALLSVAVSRFLQPTLSAVSIVKRRLGDGGEYVIASPADVANELNRAFPWNAKTGQFFTIVYGVFDTRNRQFRFVTAGHPGLIHVPCEGMPVSYQATGMPIGLSKEPYTEDTVELQARDRLYLFSDGVSETMNPAKDLYGVNRLMEVADKCRESSLEDSLTCVLFELEKWRDGTLLRDDVTLLGCGIAE